MSQSKVCVHCGSTNTISTDIRPDEVAGYKFEKYRCKACKRDYKVITLRGRFVGKQKLVKNKWKNV